MAMTNTSWFTLSPNETLDRLEVSVGQGLTSSQIQQRLQQYGPNQLQEGQQRPAWRMFVDQFRDFMILVLLAAAVVSGVIGDAVDTIAILVIVTLNAVIGSVQEYRAEKAMLALKAMATPYAQVRRNGQLLNIHANELVPGDVVLLEAGNIVPADIRLLEAVGLEANESMLTGESVGVIKHSDALLKTESLLAEQQNMLFKGSQINRGRAVGVVVATGMSTELGKIATLLQGAPDLKTPLQQRLTDFGRRLALVILAICAVIFVVGLLRDESAVLMFLTAISLAVAAIPEALPAVVSVALALGARRMTFQRALVRNLPAVETLGSVTYICTDKTGTLTQNRMQVEAYWIGGSLTRSLPNSEERLAQAMALSNDVADGEQGPLGDPTEIALYQAALNHGYEKSHLIEHLPRVAELAFDSDRKRMSTFHKAHERLIMFCKGAPEQVLPSCDNTNVTQVLQQAEQLAAEGYRVLAIAYREFDQLPQPVTIDAEQQMTFLGLVALIDPPRDEVPQAVIDCQTAGITPVMITGDHPATALAIAKRLNIVSADERVLTGHELEGMDLSTLKQSARSIRVYARVSPAQKIKIVQALQELGEFCAMTGDGVNDAPALKRADIGVAMGKKGTDVARQASDMVLLDDNFATIVAAVKEGRRIFDNIRKFVKYTMTSNSGEIWVLFLAPFMGLPIPLLPIHILWINLVTDGLPGLALTAEPAEKGIMQRSPRSPNESMFAHGMWQHMLWVGLLIAAVSLVAQAWAYANNSHWQTMVFTVLTFSQLVHVIAIRSESQSLFQIGLMSNPMLLGAVTLTVFLQLSVIYIPMLNPVFNTAPLTVVEMLICIGLSLVVFVAVEIEKICMRRKWIYSPTY